MIRRFLSGRAPVRVQPYFGYRNHNALVVSARALRRREPVFDQNGFWGGLATMIGQYASREVAGLDVQLEFRTGAGKAVRHTATTCQEGFARFEIPFADRCDLPANTGWERATLSWHADGSGSMAEKTAFILAPGSSAGLGVISDIDDTILETGITGSVRAIAKNWRRVMAQMPGERIVVPGAPDFYAALSGDSVGGATGAAGAGTSLHSGGPVARPRPIFYVSSSPWNLFSYLVAYMKGRGLPLGPIMLRDWGLNRETFGSASHGAHKRAAIDGILATYPDMKFARIGDDSQGDLTAFADVAAHTPHRVRAVFIRKVGEAMSPEELAAEQSLKAAGIPLWMGEGYEEGRKFLASIGLLEDTEAKNIVKSVGKPRTESA